jgi:hypothetical protein
VGRRHTVQFQTYYIRKRRTSSSRQPPSSICPAAASNAHAPMKGASPPLSHCSSATARHIAMCGWVGEGGTRQAAQHLTSVLHTWSVHTHTKAQVCAWRLVWSVLSGAPRRTGQHVGSVRVCRHHLRVQQRSTTQHSDCLALHYGCCLGTRLACCIACLELLRSLSLRGATRDRSRLRGSTCAMKVSACSGAGVVVVTTSLSP